MPSFSAKSRAKLNTCSYNLQKVFNEVIKYRDCTIAYGHRTPEEQFELYKQGRVLRGNEWTKVGVTVTNCDGNKVKSKHNTYPSQAVDAYPYIDGKMIQSEDECRMFAGFVIGVANSMGIKLVTGADWDSDGLTTDQTFHDICHFEDLGPSDYIEPIPIKKPGTYLLKPYDTFRFKAIGKLQDASIKKPKTGIVDKVISLTNGLKTIGGSVITSVGIIQGLIANPTKLTYIAIILGVILLIVGILHKVAKNSSTGEKGQFWIGDLAKFILNIITKKEA